MNKSDFDTFFRQATGLDNGPYCYQRKLAEDESLPTLLNIPTGLGKTAAVVLAWLYRRRFHPNKTVRESTPRRLVYCLPMRTLVEQTERAACCWINNLAKQDGSLGKDPVFVHVLMGGAEAIGWDEYPEQDAIVIGTQDMLLSRALNRGYGMSRYRWPITFSLLNNDCLWIIDETQLMGVGLTTSAQLQGLRAKLNTYGASQSLWMSATLDDEALSTVDHRQPEEGWETLELTDDLGRSNVQQLFEAKKHCQRASLTLSSENIMDKYPVDLAEAILKEHVVGTLTLAVINRVERAQQLFQAIQKHRTTNQNPPEIYLIHSRFRHADRAAVQEMALNEDTIFSDGPGRILISTQAIEAGVDVSATTLFTELSPWSSMVQRFGRCNRRGKCGKDDCADARVFWIDIDTSDSKKAKELALPYASDELDAARKFMSMLNDAGPKSLQGINYKSESSIVHTIRRKDLMELWDTTPDLGGNDLDVSRYIRDTDDTDVQVYWREWDTEAKETKGEPPRARDAEGQLFFPSPSREELCSVSIGKAKKFLEQLHKRKEVKNNTIGVAWWWNPLDGEWERVDPYRLRPGMVVLLNVDAGGYDPLLGWTGDTKHKPDPISPEADDIQEPEFYDSDVSGSKPLLLTAHLQNVVCAASLLKEGFKHTLSDIPWQSIITAALWHDVGKAHQAARTAMQDFDTIKALDPLNQQIWAKSGSKGIPNYRIIEKDADGNDKPIKRRGFRHELASALTWLASSNGQPDYNLVAFLIAAHHGKVRGSIRSLPTENKPDDPRVKFARGLWEGDKIEAVDVGDGQMTPEVTVDLSLMELGEDEQGRPSWLARVLKLRDEYGPFRLAYLETLVRIADWHGSNDGGTTDGK
ncbi:MAG: CRISPR-associated helicase Cas3' [Pirellulales bacterium]|nr:CRISPR-associated helicase Cas3' [Pirellulales bacterium]